MASKGWPRPWEGSFKQFPELVAKEQKYFTDHAWPEPKFHVTAFQTADLKAGVLPLR